MEDSAGVAVGKAPEQLESEEADVGHGQQVPALVHVLLQVLHAAQIGYVIAAKTMIQCWLSSHYAA